MHLPTKFYRVVAVKPGDKLRWSEPGSKTYARLDHAESHLDSLRSRGVECYLYESEPVVWKDITPRPTNDDPTLPFD